MKSSVRIILIWEKVALMNYSRVVETPRRLGLWAINMEQVVNDLHDATVSSVAGA